MSTDLDPDRMPGDWHKLFPDHYEGAVAEASGALSGHLMARGVVDFRWTDEFLAAFRGAVEVAFAWGYSAGMKEAIEALADT